MQTSNQVAKQLADTFADLPYFYQRIIRAWLVDESPDFIANQVGIFSSQVPECITKSITLIQDARLPAALIREQLMEALEQKPAA